jgi:hypothetical protein
MERLSVSKEPISYGFILLRMLACEKICPTRLTNRLYRTGGFGIAIKSITRLLSLGDDALRKASASYYIEAMNLPDVECPETPLIGRLKNSTPSFLVIPFIRVRPWRCFVTYIVVR